MEMAKIAEIGRITCCFFADAYGVNDISAGKPDATYRGSCQVGQLDPFVVVSAMAAVTKTWGRVGWNVVTSYTNASARDMGFDSIMPHGQRYEKATEFIELTYRL
jgi:alkanesulfonate monooxygenase SsuD/methylene tetrahydromethanopterin reductase-like flavin-dependent oxidoreductase (luciferase family)